MHKKKTVLKKQMLFTLGDSYSGWAPFGLEGRQMASNKLPTSHRDMNLLNINYIYTKNNPTDVSHPPPPPKKEKIKICLSRYVHNKDVREPVFPPTPKLTSEKYLWTS